MIYEDIIKWVSTLDYWEKRVAYDILKSRPIGDNYNDEILNILLQENGLSDSELVKEDFDFSLEKGTDTNQKIIWKGVSDLVGINKIKSDVKLTVGTNLTLIYGENGSGKSGYTRLFNNVFISNGDKTLLTDIYENETQQQSAKFLFDEGGEEKIYSFPDDIRQQVFKSVRVFDTKSAMDDVKKENEVQCVPSELSFFDKFSDICTSVLDKFDAILLEKREKKNPLLSEFSMNSEISADIEKVPITLQVEDIKRKYNLTANDYDEVAKLRKEQKEIV